MKRWKGFYPLLHDPFNRKWVKLTSSSEYRLNRASVNDIMEAFECSREEALECYKTGDSPASRRLLSRVHAREGAEK